ncbi:hypothetical protein [Advenella sp. S44]|uniref:hypothetical protein n=1 Tax=Advenella sp. S44 TaxID=1982755 RepID=UPI000C2A5A85|nr:hypothetical protein [Advenella sp. S44]
MNEDLNSILASFGDPESPNVGKLKRNVVLGWMRSQDINTMGAIYSLLLKRVYTNRIEPPLAFEDYKDLFLRFYERCITEDLALAYDLDSFVLSRYTAAHDFTRWFISVFQDNQIPRDHIDEIKNWLRQLYIDGSSAVKLSIETGILEHLFTVEQIKRDFSDWKSDPLLKSAYQSAPVSH